MNILALETSTKIGSVCLLQKGKVTTTRSSENQKSHSDFVHKAIEEILCEVHLSLSDIDGFASGQGPGSFTGIRIAINAVRTFAYILKKPVICENSLQILAEQVEEKSYPVLTLINAYKNMNYAAIFDHTKSGWQSRDELTAVPVLEMPTWIKKNEKMIVVGDGFLNYEKFFPQELKNNWLRPENPLDYPLSQTLAKIADKKLQLNETIEWNFLKPLYIRASEAEENYRGVRFTPLK